MCVKVTASHRWDVFLRHSVFRYCKLKDIFCTLANNFITFCVSRRPREMYCGHARLCVCLSVCVCPRPHAHSIARTRM